VGSLIVSESPNGTRGVANHASVYRFGEFILDAPSGDLRRGHRSIRLRPQPTAILEHFLRHPGEVVTRDELRQVVWPEGTYVHFDHGLNSCIKQIRTALADSRGAPRYLETLPRRGYRFIQPVSLAMASGNEASAGDLALSGSVHVNGRRIKIAISLREVSQTGSVWSRTFERALEGPSSPEEIASSILDRLARGEAI
jgi:DNA-binding winged helix-turn-helix (wHTH) protein